MSQSISIIKWNKRRTSAELISPALRDRARAQNALAFHISHGHYPMIRTHFSYGRCVVIIDNIEYDIEKVKKLPKYIGILNRLYERG